MAIVLTKPKVKPVEAPAEQITVPETDLAKRIEAMGNLQAKAQKLREEISAAMQTQFKTKLEQAALLEKKIAEELPKLAADVAAKFDDKDPDAKFTEPGEKHYQAELSKKGNQRSIKEIVEVELEEGKPPVQKPGVEVIKMLLDNQDSALFWKFAKINLKDLDAYLTPPELADVLKTERTQRSVTIAKVK